MAEPLAVLALGYGLGWSLAAPPGPIAALAAERAAHRGFWPGAVVCLGASVGDGTYALAMGVGLIPLVSGRPLLLASLTTLGALLMMWFAYAAYRTARRPPAGIGEVAPEGARGFAKLGLLRGGAVAGFVLALTSPYNLAWWLGAGTALFHDYGALVFVGFFAALASYSVAWTALFTWAGRRARWVVPAVSYVSAALLAGFAALLLLRGVTGLRDALL